MPRLIGSGSNSASDPLWANVLLYIPGDGVDDSLGIIDLSNYQRAVTRVADVKIKTDQMPAGSPSSVYFDGTADSLAVAGDSDFDFGLDDYCIEFYGRRTANAGDQTWFIRRDTLSTGLGYQMLTNSSGDTLCQASGDGSTWLLQGNFGVAPVANPINAWHHYVFNRQSGLFRMHVNGALAVSNNSHLTTPLFDNTGDLLFGIHPGGSAALQGWMRSIRVTRGSARYLNGTTFTPPHPIFPTK